MVVGGTDVFCSNKANHKSVGGKSVVGNTLRQQKKCLEVKNENEPSWR